MKYILIFLTFIQFLAFPQEYINNFGEQVYAFRFEPEIKVLVNAPAKMDTGKPAGIIFYALPNGNTTEQTIGKKLEPGDDWHFGIQNIGAQTRFLRNKIREYNVVTVYLETDQKSWPQWKSLHDNYKDIVKDLTAMIMKRFERYDPFVILSGHSGGGRFVFSFIDAYDSIPSFVKRICFLDSDYGYEHEYGTKITGWFNKSNDNYLCIIAYNDSCVVLNGKNIVSPTGGTWYRSIMFKNDLSQDYQFSEQVNNEFMNYEAEQGRIKFFLKKNPANEILHTVQIEKNGFIHSILTGTKYENDGYIYFGERAYE